MHRLRRHNLHQKQCQRVSSGRYRLINRCRVSIVQSRACRSLCCVFGVVCNVHQCYHSHQRKVRFLFNTNGSTVHSGRVRRPVSVFVHHAASQKVGCSLLGGTHVTNTQQCASNPPSSTHPFVPTTSAHRPPDSTSPKTPKPTAIVRTTEMPTRKQHGVVQQCF